MLEKILILLNSKWKNNYNKTIFVEIMDEIKEKKIPNNFCDSYITDLTNQFSDISNNDCQVNISFESCQKIIKFFKIIRDQAVSKVIINESEKLKKNPFYSKQFSLELIELSIEFPMWTHVMCGAEDEVNYHEKIDQYTKKLLEISGGILSVDKYLLNIIDFNAENMQT